jgi:hypothetical protein
MNPIYIFTTGTGTKHLWYQLAAQIWCCRTPSQFLSIIIIQLLGCSFCVLLCWFGLSIQCRTFQWTIWLEECEEPKVIFSANPPTLTHGTSAFLHLTIWLEECEEPKIIFSANPPTQPMAHLPFFTWLSDWLEECEETKVIFSANPPTLTHGTSAFLHHHSSVARSWQGNFLNLFFMRLF